MFGRSILVCWVSNIEKIAPHACQPSDAVELLKEGHTGLESSQFQQC